MDVAIPYKFNENEKELKFALRSIEKYLKGWVDVIVIGDQHPPGLKDLNFQKVHGPVRKQLNIKEKILHACNDEYISDDFIYWADDIFLQRKLDVKDFKFWFETYCKRVSDHQVGAYKMAIDNTMKVVGDYARYYDCHHPMILNKELFKQHVGFDWGNKEYVIKTLYGNKARTHLSEQVKEAKVFNDMGEAAIRKEIEGKLFFSTKNHVINKSLIKVFESLYPDKSKFEV